MRFVGGERLCAVPAFFHNELVEFGIDRERIFPGETREAEMIHRFTRGPYHSFKIEIAKTVDAEILADLFHRKLIRDQFLWIRKIDAVMAGEAMRRAAHAHVYLLGAGFSQIDDAGARGRAADDGIIHHDNAFPFHRFFDQIKFYAHIEIANELTRLEKRASTGNLRASSRPISVRTFATFTPPIMLSGLAK